MSHFVPLGNGRVRQQCMACQARYKRVSRKPRKLSQQRVRCACGKSVLSSSVRRHVLGRFHRKHLSRALSRHGSAARVHAMTDKTKTTMATTTTTTATAVVRQVDSTRTGRHDESRTTARVQDDILGTARHAHSHGAKSDRQQDANRVSGPSSGRSKMIAHDERRWPRGDRPTSDSGERSAGQARCGS
jgi:hypothetical protein